MPLVPQPSWEGGKILIVVASKQIITLLFSPPLILNSHTNSAKIWFPDIRILSRGSEQLIEHGNSRMVYYHLQRWKEQQAAAYCTVSKQYVWTMPIFIAPSIQLGQGPPQVVSMGFHVRLFQQMNWHMGPQAMLGNCATFCEHVFGINLTAFTENLKRVLILSLKAISKTVPKGGEFTAIKLLADHLTSFVPHSCFSKVGQCAFVSHVLQQDLPELVLSRFYRDELHLAENISQIWNSIWSSNKNQKNNAWRTLVSLPFVDKPVPGASSGYW